MLYTEVVYGEYSQTFKGYGMTATGYYEAATTTIAGSASPDDAATQCAGFGTAQQNTGQLLEFNVNYDTILDVWNCIYNNGEDFGNDEDPDWTPADAYDAAATVGCVFGYYESQVGD